MSTKFKTVKQKKRLYEYRHNVADAVKTVVASSKVTPILIVTVAGEKGISVQSLTKAVKNYLNFGRFNLLMTNKSYLSKYRHVFSKDLREKLSNYRTSNNAYHLAKRSLTPIEECTIIYDKFFITVKRTDLLNKYNISSAQLSELMFKFSVTGTAGGKRIINFNEQAKIDMRVLNYICKCMRTEHVSFDEAVKRHPTKLSVLRNADARRIYIHTLHAMERALLGSLHFNK